jgi:hypothetical protein
MYILIVLSLYIGSPNNRVEMQEFSSQTTCLVAKNLIVEAHNSSSWVAACVPK